MTATQLANLIRLKTRTTSATFTNDDMLVYVNTFMDEIAGRIQQQRPEIWNIPALADLEAGKREYAFPDDVLNNIVSLELKLSTSGSYVPARPYKKAPSDFALTEAEIAATYGNLVPCYFVRRRAVYVLSGAIPAVTDGFKLVYNAFPKHLTSMVGSTDLSIDPSTTEHGFPREFHELLARRVAIEFKSNNPENELSAAELSYGDDLEAALDNFSTVNLDLEEIAEVAADTTDHGFNL